MGYRKAQGQQGLRPKSQCVLHCEPLDPCPGDTRGQEGPKGRKAGKLSTLYLPLGDSQCSLPSPGSGKIYSKNCGWMDGRTDRQRNILFYSLPNGKNPREEVKAIQAPRAQGRTIHSPSRPQVWLEKRRNLFIHGFIHTTHSGKSSVRDEPWEPWEQPGGDN